MEEIKKVTELDTVATGYRIKELMDAKHVSTKHISEQLCVSFQAVYRWQKGETLPTINNMFVLAQLLNTSIDNMLVGKHK